LRGCWKDCALSAVGYLPAAVGRLIFKREQAFGCGELQLDGEYLELGRAGLPWLCPAASSQFGAGRIRRAHERASIAIMQQAYFRHVVILPVVPCALGSLIDRTG
jgi:hypothetical protein